MTRDATVRLLYVVVSLLYVVVSLLYVVVSLLCGKFAVRCGESAVTERLAVSPLRTRGDAPPWRASPLVVAVQGVRRYGSTGCVDVPRGASGRPHGSTIRRPVPPVVTDRVPRPVSGNAVASAAECRRQPQFRLRTALINRYRQFIVTE
jgi:hypothetical protein